MNKDDSWFRGLFRAKAAAVDVRAASLEVASDAAAAAQRAAAELAAVRRAMAIAEYT